MAVGGDPPIDWGRDEGYNEPPEPNPYARPAGHPDYEPPEEKLELPAPSKKERRQYAWMYTFRARRCQARGQIVKLGRWLNLMHAVGGPPQPPTPAPPEDDFRIEDLGDYVRPPYSLSTTSTAPISQFGRRAMGPDEAHIKPQDYRVPSFEAQADLFFDEEWEKKKALGGKALGGKK